MYLIVFPEPPTFFVSSAGFPKRWVFPSPEKNRHIILTSDRKRWWHLKHFWEFFGPRKVGGFWGLRFPNWTKKPKPLKNLGKGLEPHTSSPQPCWGKLRSVQALYFRDMGWPLTHLGLVLAGGFLLRMLTQHIQARKVKKTITRCWELSGSLDGSWMVKRWVMKLFFFFSKGVGKFRQWRHTSRINTKTPMGKFPAFSRGKGKNIWWSKKCQLEIRPLGQVSCFCCWIPPSDEIFHPPDGGWTTSSYHPPPSGFPNRRKIGEYIDSCENPDEHL